MTLIDIMQGASRQSRSHAYPSISDCSACPLISPQGVHGPVQVYFGQFRKTPFGMLRLDPQDAGPGYRNVIGIPGGITSPLFRVLQVCPACSFLVYTGAICRGASATK